MTPFLKHFLVGFVYSVAIFGTIAATCYVMASLLDYLQSRFEHGALIFGSLICCIVVGINNAITKW